MAEDSNHDKENDADNDKDEEEDDDEDDEAVPAGEGRLKAKCLMTSAPCQDSALRITIIVIIIAIVIIIITVVLIIAALKGIVHQFCSIVKISYFG